MKGRSLKLWEAQVARGRQVILRAEGLCFAELAAEFLTDDRINRKRSLDAVRAYVKERQEARYSNAEINRELAALKRMFHLALQQTRPKEN